eukprot:6539-Pyramimonas_sp.AAC.1
MLSTHRWGSSSLGFCPLSLLGCGGLFGAPWLRAPSGAFRGARGGRFQALQEAPGGLGPLGPCACRWLLGGRQAL